MHKILVTIILVGISLTLLTIATFANAAGTSQKWSGVTLVKETATSKSYQTGSNKECKELLKEVIDDLRGKGFSCSIFWWGPGVCTVGKKQVGVVCKDKDILEVGTVE